jgi:hypothetical protein
MQRLLSKHTRPGRALHMACIATVFLYALVARFYESLGVAPVDDFASARNALGMLRIGFALIGLAGLTIAITFLLRPHLVGSIDTAFVIAYAMLDALSTYGLTLFLMSVHWLDFCGFAIPALAGLLLLWTQAGRWDRLTSMEQSEMRESG